MDAVAIPEPISAVKDFLSKSQKLLIDGKRVDAAAPFGGYKKSGFGREMGIHALGKLYAGKKRYYPTS